MFGMRFQRGLPLARRFNRVRLRLHRLPLHWTCSPRNRCTATADRPVLALLGPCGGRKFLERDWNIKPNTVPDVIAWCWSLQRPLSLFSQLFPDHHEVGLCFVSDCPEELRGSLVPLVDLRIHLLRSFGHKAPFNFANESHPDPFPLMFRLHSEMVDPTTSSVPTAHYTTHDLIDLFSNEEQIWVSLEFQLDIFKFVSWTKDQASC